MKLTGAAKELFSNAGKIGGKLRWKGSTKAERREFAMKGVRARAKKRNGNSG